MLNALIRSEARQSQKETSTNNSRPKRATKMRMNTTLDPIAFGSKVTMIAVFLIRICRNTPKRTVHVQHALAYSRERPSHSLLF